MDIIHTWCYRILRSVFVLLVLLGNIITATSSAEAVNFHSEPTHITIPSLNISLPVRKAPIVYDTWDVSLDAVSYGESSTLPGNVGNTILFGHALPAFFASLPDVKKGEYVHVFTENDWFVYKIEDTFIVNPEDVYVLEPSRKYDLTVYTCVGPNYEQRFIVKARLISVNSSTSF